MRKDISLILFTATVVSWTLTAVDVGTGPVLGSFAVFAAIVVVATIEGLTATTALVHASKGLNRSRSHTSHDKGHREDQQ